MATMAMTKTDCIYQYFNYNASNNYEKHLTTTITSFECRNLLHLQLQLHLKLQLHLQLLGWLA